MKRSHRPLRGSASKAPCWWCSRQLHGWKGAIAKVDGNEVAFHNECLKGALEDEHFKGRIEPPPWWLMGGAG